MELYKRVKKKGRSRVARLKIPGSNQSQMFLLSHAAQKVSTLSSHAQATQDAAAGAAW